MLAPLARSLAPGGRLLAIQSYGRDAGLEIVQRLWPDENPFQVDRHELLAALRDRARPRRAQLHARRRAPTTRRIFRYHMHTLPSEIGDRIGTSTLFAAWNAAIYVNQIEDERLDAGDRQQRVPRGDAGRAAEARRALVQRRDLRRREPASMKRRRRPTSGQPVTLPRAPIADAELTRRIVDFARDASMEVTPDDERTDPGARSGARTRHRRLHGAHAEGDARGRREDGGSVQAAGLAACPHIVARRIAEPGSTAGRPASALARPGSTELLVDRG